jgi:superfamily II DNA or RNA helicase
VVDPKKNTIMNHLYEHMDELDWMDGLDMYQAGYVSNLRAIESLITAKVSSTSERTPSEVRIKIHPTGTNIQWIECSCRKNRVQGRYCEHIGATMLHIDREAPKLFAHLDPKMPLKPPPTPARKKPSDPVPQKVEKKANATEALMSQLEGQIHSVALLAKGPEIRVRVEIKEGQLTTYNLGIDDAAKFLATHVDSGPLSPELKQLKIHSNKARLGTRVVPTGNDGDIRAEKVIGIEFETTAKSKTKPPEGISSEDLTSIDSYNELTETEKNVKWLQFFSSKNLARFIGKNWSFVEGVGYFPFEPQSVKASWHDLPQVKTMQADDAARLCESGFQSYKEHGLVWASPELDESSIINQPKFSQLNLVELGDNWFTVKPEFAADETSISMVQILLAYRQKKREFLRAGKKWLRIPDIIKNYAWNLDEAGESLKVDRLGMIRLKAAIGDFDQLAGSKQILNRIRNETEFSPEKPAPALTHTGLNLRSYQQEGYQWMWWLYDNGLSGLLADEMGLGKTHQTMALLSAIWNAKPNAQFLIVCPTTVLDHWLDKITDFSSVLSPIKYHGPKRHQLVDFSAGKSLTLLSSYGIVMRDIDILLKVEWDAVVLDEAHFVKNIDTATYRAVCRLNSKSRYCLSGTPMENHLGELKAVYDFLLPGYLGSQDYFKQRYLSPVEGQAGDQATMELQKLIHPFKMRRTKNLVLKDLPEKVEDLRHCELSDEQTTMYRQTLDLKAQPLLDVVKDETKAIPFLHVFSVITLLKQIADHPALLTGADDWRNHQSGKFELFKELIDEAMDSGHKVVVYSQYLDMLSIISQYLAQEKIEHRVLTGSTRNRGQIIHEFQTDDTVKVFCASLLAGGIGIDLTAASVVIHYDRWWNASKENQATDRVHRIGQNKNVQVLKLITRQTLEERIDALIKKKQELFERFLDHDEDVFKSLSRSDIIELLQ